MRASRYAYPAIGKPRPFSKPSKLDAFAQAWGGKYPAIVKTWRAKWKDIITIFDFRPAIRKAIYTTNAIESVTYDIYADFGYRGELSMSD